MAKVIFRNGSAFEIPDEDDPNAGRGLTPFKPHPCQEWEVETRSLFGKFYKVAEQFSSHLIENGRHFTIKGRLLDGKIFIDEESVEPTTASDNEYILFDSKK